MKIFIWVHILTTGLFTVWLLYVWTKGSNFGSQPSCNYDVKYVLFFAGVRARGFWLQLPFIVTFIYAVSVLLLGYFPIPCDDNVEEEEPQESLELDELGEPIEPQERGSSLGRTILRHVTLYVVTPAFG